MRILGKVCIVVMVAWVLRLSAAIDGTTGTPLGGLGTGAVKFKASDGTFSFTDATPTRRYDYSLVSGAQFQFYSYEGGNVVTRSPLVASRDASGRVEDDAAFPTHIVHFGTINDIELQLTAYAPFVPGQVDSMSLPCAFYEFSVRNTGTQSVSASIALMMPTGSVPNAATGKGFFDTTSQHQRCVFVRSSGGFPVTVSAGNGSEFFQTGNCTSGIHGTTNRTAASFTLDPGASGKLTFIFAWYNRSDPSRYYYTNLYSNAVQVADAGLNACSSYSAHAAGFVERMRASNLPTWLTDQTLNSLVNIVNNSIYTADGRYCHNEGMYYMDGTMDQMWHARQINTELLPEIAWKELEYWGRCQKKAAGAEGQIHHDFGSNSNYIIAGWDDSEYQDYRDINAWVDLNCGYIISVYEAYIATGDKSKLTLLWPYVKKAGQRILNQVALYQDATYPYTFSTSLSSYDAGGNSQAYNTGLSIVAYKIMSRLAGEMGESSLSSTYDTTCTAASTNFSRRWLDNAFTAGPYCESALGGPWIAGFLKLGQFWPSNKINNLYSAMVNYYDPITNGLGSAGYNQSWQTYLTAHLGGFALQAGKTDIWYALQHDMYVRNIENRNLVFDQQLGIPQPVISPTYLATNTSGSDQYISIPVVWRNYFDMVGFHRNKPSHEIWLEPRLPADLNHSMANASVPTPEGFVTISAVETGTSWQNQQITVTSDSPMAVDSLYVDDRYSTVQSVTVNGTNVTYVREGTGYQAHLKIYWSGSLGSSAVQIAVTGDPVVLHIPAAPDLLRATAVSASRIDLVWRNNASNETGFAIECKVGGIFKRVGTAGPGDTTFSHTGLMQNNLYTYRVAALNDDGASGYSNEASATTLEAGNGEVMVAVNSGGSDYTGTDGIHYSTDIGASFCTGGSTYSTTSTIRGTTDPALYQTERYGNPFSYAFPLGNGAYDVTLKFAEIYQTAPGTRVFSVMVEQIPVLSNLDLFSIVGKDSAYDVTIPVTVSGDGVLNISFTATKDNAKVSALVVRKSLSSNISTPTNADRTPTDLYLSPNYPNPFNPGTVIRYGLPKDMHVRLAIYDIDGREVDVLVNRYQPAGNYQYNWNASGSHARSVAAGVYILRLQADKFQKTQKLILLK